jgi:hypothetical protein
MTRRKGGGRESGAVLPGSHGMGTGSNAESHARHQDAGRAAASPDPTGISFTHLATMWQKERTRADNAEEDNIKAANLFRGVAR